MPVATRGKVRPLEEVEKEYILAALELNGGNQTHTADAAPHRRGDPLPQAKKLRDDQRQARGNHRSGMTDGACS